MMHVREPILETVPIAELRPTQITVGMREVEEKRRHWREMSPEKDMKFLGTHLIPVVLGPKERRYVTDHHHLARALHDEGVTDVLTTVVTRLDTLDRESFWRVMDMRALTHPYDAEGKRRGYEDLPKAIAELVDDPYRSLAGELRRVGGFAKDTTPFSEFQWADFLRPRIKRKHIAKDFEDAISRALELAKGKEASYLPGWCGPS